MSDQWRLCKHEWVPIPMTLLDDIRLNAECIRCGTATYRPDQPSMEGSPQALADKGVRRIRRNGWDKGSVYLDPPWAFIHPDDEPAKAPGTVLINMLPGNDWVEIVEDER